MMDGVRDKTTTQYKMNRIKLAISTWRHLQFTQDCQNQFIKLTKHVAYLRTARCIAFRGNTFNVGYLSPSVFNGPIIGEQARRVLGLLITLPLARFRCVVIATCSPCYWLITAKARRWPEEATYCICNYENEKYDHLRFRCRAFHAECMGLDLGGLHCYTNTLPITCASAEQSLSTSG